MRPAINPTASAGVRRAARFIGRGDLLRALSHSPNPHGGRVAASLGFEREISETPPEPKVERPRQRRRPSLDVQPPTTVTPVVNLGTDQAWPAVRQPSLFWRCVELLSLAVGQDESSLQLPDRIVWSAVPSVAAKTQLLCTWRRLNSRLRALLVSPLAGREVDVPRMVEQLAEGRIEKRLPLVASRRWGSRVQLVVDRSERLMPYFEDQWSVIRELRRILGRDQLEVYYGSLPGTAHQTDFRRIESGGREGPAYVVPESPAKVVILGDFGCLDRSDPSAVHRWEQWIDVMLGRGLSVIGLLPCHPGRLSSPIRSRIRACAWSGAAAVLLPPEEREKVVDRLLGLVSKSVRVEPGFLRDCRLALPSASDPGLESEAWQNRVFVGRASEAGTLGPATEVERFAQRFQKESIALQHQVLNRLRHWRTAVGPEVYFEELSRLSPETLASLPAQDLEEAIAAWRFLLAVAESREQGADNQVVEFATRVVQRMSDDTLLHPSIGPIAQRLRQVLIPAGENPIVRTPQNCSLWLQGADLVLAGWTERSPMRLENGSPLATLRTTTGVVRLCSTSGSETADDSLTVSLNDGSQVRIILPKTDEVSVQTNCAIGTFQRKPKTAPLALAAGRDRFGLWELTAIPNKQGPPVRVRWRWIPPGTFWMGSPEDEPGRWKDEGPRHLVTLTKGYWMAETPCTQELWQAVMGQNPSRFPNDQHPVETVSWLRVQAFLKQLRQIAPDLGVDLPTEAQWEYACRAGSETALYPTEAGDGTIDILGERDAPLLDPIAWYGGNSAAPANIERAWNSSDWKETQRPHTRASTQPVGLKLPNAWGLFDMLGNVWEWCHDEWGDYRSEPETDPARLGNSNAGVVSRVCRGGSWSSHARNVRCAFRNQIPVEAQNYYLGFRLVRVQKPS